MMASLQLGLKLKAPVIVPGVLGLAILKARIFAVEVPFPFTAKTLIGSVVTPEATPAKLTLITGSSEFPSPSRSSLWTPSGKSQWYLAASAP